MPIKGITDKPRFPRIGKMHLGIKTGAGYPQPIDYFLVKEDGSTSKTAFEAFRKVYGEQPKSLDILLAYDSLDDIFPQWMKRFSKRGQGGLLACRGDGIDASVLDEPTGKWNEQKGLCKTCEYLKDNKCKRVGNFKFMLPYVDGAGIWQIDTGSRNSMRNINDSVFLALSYARIAGKPPYDIPLRLEVQMEDVSYTTPDGKKMVRKLPIMHLAILKSLAEIQKESKEAKAPTKQLGAPATEDEKEIPEDLAPDMSQPAAAAPSRSNAGASDAEVSEAVEEEAAPSSDKAPTATDLADLESIKERIRKCTKVADLKLLSKDVGSLMERFSQELKRELSEEYNKKHDRLVEDAFGK